MIVGGSLSPRQADSPIADSLRYNRLMPIPKRKAFAYITHCDPRLGERLLVFSHPNAPEAGIQVPAGTMRDDESPAAAALREAHEETGLEGLELVRLLGEQIRDMADSGRDEIHHRWFFHLRCSGDPPAIWRNYEPDPDDGSPELPLFELFWAPLPEGIPDLIADHGIMLPALLDSLTASLTASPPTTAC
jgi:8-oxo-dGTP diphosphatase